MICVFVPKNPTYDIYGFTVRLVDQGTKHASFREAFDKVSWTVVCVGFGHGGGTAEHNHGKLRRLINDFLSTWWEVCRRVTWGSLSGSVLLVIFYQLLGLKVCLSHFQLPQNGEGLLIA